MCNLHVQQRMLLSCVEDWCMKTRYKEDAKFATDVRCLGTLAFVPPKHVVRVFKEMPVAERRTFCKADALS